MDTLLLPYGLWCLCASLAAFALCGWDKRAARLGRRRIPERRLLAVALLGGACGLWLGMALFRHKTRHWRFVLAAPLLSALQLALGGWIAAGAQARFF